MASNSGADAFNRFPMMQRFVDMFGGNPNMQKLIQLGLEAELQHADEDLEVVSDFDLQWDKNEKKYNLIKKNSRKITYAEFLEMNATFGMSSAYSEDKESTKDAATLDEAEDELCECDVCEECKECLHQEDQAKSFDIEVSDNASEGSSDEEHGEVDLTDWFCTKAAEMLSLSSKQKQEDEEKIKSPAKEEQKLPEKSTGEESHVE